jgi:acetyl-CoA acetyltransferase
VPRTARHVVFVDGVSGGQFGADIPGRQGRGLMIQLARQFAGQPAARYGLTTMCVGMGMGGTVLWENINA